MENMCEKHLINRSECSIKEKYKKFALSTLDHEKRSFGPVPQSMFFLI